MALALTVAFFHSSAMAATPLFSCSNRRSVMTNAATPFRLLPKVWGVDLRRNPRHAGFRSFFASSTPPRSPPNPPPNEIEEKEGGLGLNSTYKWCVGLGALGLVEVSYLTYVKVFGVDAFCPVDSGGFGGCGDVLNSDYAAVFGIPLPILGAITYGLTTFLALRLSKNDSDTNLRRALLGTTTSMATASAYFLYILNTKLSGTFCPYCISSVALSFALFFLTLKELNFEEIQKSIGLQLAVAGLVIASLNGSYNSIQPKLSPENLVLEPIQTEITTTSTPFANSLAKHLHSIGAKIYGAFYCSHCHDQKQMFGREAMKILDYVECYPNGAGRGRSIIKECAVLKMEGFPSWLINGELLKGEKTLKELADASDFSLEGLDLQ